MKERSPLRPTSASHRAELERTLRRYEAAVTPQAAAWVDARGISEATALGARLGVVSDPAPGHEPYRGMLAIPYLRPDGEPLTMRFRCFQEHEHREFGHGKYMSLAHDEARLYNVRAIDLADDELHVAEGEFDALILNQAGLPAIAVPGASAWKGSYGRLMAGFNRIFVWSDPDRAGAEMLARLRKAIPRCVGVRLDREVGDVSETFIAGGRQALLASLQEESS